VDFEGVSVLPSSASVAVNATGNSNSHCTLSQAEAYANRTVLDVECHKPTGAFVDAPFVAHFVGSRALLGAKAPKAAWAEDGLVNVHPAQTIPSFDRYMSNGKAVTVSHTAAGIWTFTLPGMASTATHMVQAFGSTNGGDVRCTANASSSGTTEVVTAKCFDALGKPANVTVTVDYEAA
jgi:hypothetical protein